MTILNDFNNIILIFIRGEICIEESYLFFDYQSRDNLTKRAHLVHDKYDRLYKTNNIDFFEVNENIIFCYRRDLQTKLHE